MVSWWEHLSFSAAFLWLILIIGIVMLVTALLRASGRPEVLDPPSPKTLRGTTEAAGKVWNEGQRK